MRLIHKGGVNVSPEPITSVYSVYMEGRRTMSQQQNIAAMQHFGESVNSGNLAGLRQVISPDSLDNDPAPGQARGPEGYIGFFTMMRAAFPDLHIAVEKLIADEDTVAFAYTVTGTHQGDFQGIAPTGKRIKARGVQLSRFENGLMVERWGSSDELGILKQFGQDPTAAR